MCICSNEKNYDECCGLIISQQVKAKTPEELMRSRYSAYVKSNTDYLLQSTLKENQYEEDAALIEEFSSQVEWLGLKILNAKDDTVEFKAYYRENQNIKVLHEKSTFVVEDGTWKYRDGELYNSKVERNEPCPCGSGKKYKKCCS